MQPPPQQQTRAQALEDISGLGTRDVVELLRKNGVDEACWKAVEKRQIDGDELLHLTEGKLALWKSDLTRPLIWSLWTFVEELKKSPEKYVGDKETQQQPQSEPSESPNQQKQQQQQQVSNVDELSDTGSWDTDFEDGVDEPGDESSSNTTQEEMKTRANPDFRNSLRLFQEADACRGSSFSCVDKECDVYFNEKQNKLVLYMMHNLYTISLLDYRINTKSDNKPSTTSTDPLPCESTYANCEILDQQSSSESESTYANVGYADASPPPPPVTDPLKNTSRLHSSPSGEQKSLAEKLKEQLMLMNNQQQQPQQQPPASVKPIVAPKPEGLVKRREEVIVRTGEPRASFLHQVAAGRPKVNGVNSQKKMSPPPAAPTEPSSTATSITDASKRQSTTEEQLRNLPKPPVTIRGFDLVANLPTARHGHQDESEEDDDDEEEGYEAFDEQIVEQHQRNSMIRADSGQSLSSARQNSVESVYRPPSSSVSHDEEEMYEIYESITESPEENGHDFKNQPSTKTAVNPPPLPAKPPPNFTSLQNHLNKTDAKTERSLEKKSATLPHSGSNTSLSNAARPLPPPPDKATYYDKTWFHNLTREQANQLIEKQCTYGNASDGYFLMRPSTSNPNNPLTLVLWCKDRVYNVPVRRRPDSRYALGSAKPDEQSFASIDDIIPFYKKEKLVLYTGGVQTGSTCLTDTPPK